MIILTAAEADKVRGLAPSATWPAFGRAALQPVPLKDGTFMLPEGVLLDPSHLDVHDFLSALPRVNFTDIPAEIKFIQGNPKTGDLGNITPSEKAYLDALPKWSDAGERNLVAVGSKPK